MPTPRRTQKELSEKYKDNLANYKRLYTGRRALLAATLLAIAGGGIAVWHYSKHAPEKFFNPGPVSSHHQNITGAILNASARTSAGTGSSTNCDACHDKSLITGDRLSFGKFRQIVRASFRQGASSGRIEQIDIRCETCHAKLSGRPHTFHEPNAIQNRCSTCHQEHHGPGPMKLVASSECISCHGSATAMQAAARQKVPDHWSARDRHPQPVQRVVFDQLGRP